MNIYFTGAQGTGKTTSLNDFLKFYDKSRKKFEVQTSVTRGLIKKGIINKSSKNTDLKTQKLIIDEYLRFLHLDKENKIAERCVIDALAYTIVSTDVNKEDLLKEYKEDIDKHLKKSKVFLFTQLDELKSDGFRDIDINYQKEIENTIIEILDYYSINYVCLPKDKQQRMNIIINNLR